MNPDLQPFSVPGQATGAMITTAGGFAWMVVCRPLLVALLPGAFSAACMIAAALLYSAWKLRTDTQRLGITPPPDAEMAGRNRVLTIATAAEGVAIFASCIVAQLIRRPELAPPLIAAAIGLHLLPLARAFQRPYLNISAAALCLVAILSILFAPRRLDGPPLNGSLLCTGLGSAAVLWASTLTQLIRSRRVLNSVRGAPAG